MIARPLLMARLGYLEASGFFSDNPIITDELLHCSHIFISKLYLGMTDNIIVLLSMVLVEEVLGASQIARLFRVHEQTIMSICQS